MKKLRSAAVAAVLVLTLALAVVCISACGGYSLEEGTYTGTYTCHYTTSFEVAGTGPSAGQITKYEGDHWGATVTFDVDQNNSIWNVTSAAPAADSASDNEEYQTYVNAGMSNVFLNQFTGWTLDEIMAISVDVNESGWPTAVDGNGKTITIASGQTGTCGLVILAMQEAIRNPQTVMATE